MKRRTLSEKLTAQGPRNRASIGMGVFLQRFVVFSRLVASHFNKRVVLVCLVCWVQLTFAPSYVTEKGIFIIHPLLRD